MQSHKIEIIEVKNELGFVLPEELLKEWDIKEGSSVWIERTQNGCILSHTTITNNPLDI